MATVKAVVKDGAYEPIRDINVPSGKSLTIGGKTVPAGTQATHQADLATDANGTAIAAAVNGLRDTLIAFGIMASS